MQPYWKPQWQTVSRVTKLHLPVLVKSPWRYCSQANLFRYTVSCSVVLCNRWSVWTSEPHCPHVERPCNYRHTQAGVVLFSREIYNVTRSRKMKQNLLTGKMLVKVSEAKYMLVMSCVTLRNMDIGGSWVMFLYQLSCNLRDISLERVKHSLSWRWWLVLKEEPGRLKVICVKNA